MYSYLKHLFSDIAAAHRPDCGWELYSSINFEEEMDEIERWVEGIEPEHTFKHYCGLEPVIFPPPELLSKQEMEQVLIAFRHMMATWHLSIDLPASLPIEIAYTMTIETLNSRTAIPNSGFMTFDFCTGYAPDCVFKEYCPCLSIWNKKRS